ncbi:precorrin-3B synthase [Actinoplanes ianthinogenes]|uniref:precorrin-3B synthase n=1 Tax=Actinoplanes ianthinogenes TaxID=122358 RepID=UPI001E591D02|nr:precorrin-3B synthase [Actinoplanes ianthinogenes]
MTAHRQSDTDACPGALRLHAAADGLLARVRLPGGLLTGAQLRSLRELAEKFGDGRLELTSRANVQLRGLQASDAVRLADRLRDAGLLPSSTHDSVRNIAAPPLADSRVRELTGELDAAICGDPGLARLPGKFLFAIGQVPLAADVAAIPDGVRFGLRFGGWDTGLRVESGRVVEALIVSAHAFLAEREEQRGGGAAAWRLRELADGAGRVSARVAEALGIVPVDVPVAVPVEVVDPAALIGMVTDGDQAAGPPATSGAQAADAVATEGGQAADAVATEGGQAADAVATDGGRAAAGALVPLGRLEGGQMRVLEDAERLVITPWRGVLVPGLTTAAARAWIERLAGAGLAVTATSRWTGVTACAGRPGCARSLADVREDAEVASRFVDGLPVHWVGCARACGSPAGAHVRVEATGGGYTVTRRAGDGRPADRDQHGGGSVTGREPGPGSAPDSGLDGATGRVETFPVDVLGDVVAGARRG